LEGVVDWNYHKTSATHAVQSINGVRGVISLISIKPVATATSVKNDIEAALRRSAELDANNVEVVVHGATVELRGKVRSFAEREEAELAAWAAPGIGSVVNHIQISY
jgi:osmotically-inducible protein OsmY